MRKIKEKRMQSYVLRARKLVQEGKNKEGTEMLNDGMNYYTVGVSMRLYISAEWVKQRTEDHQANTLMD